MERIWKKLPLYLLLGLPAGYACVHFLGDGWGVAGGLVANLALWRILLRPEDQEGDSEKGS